MLLALRSPVRHSRRGEPPRPHRGWYERMVDPSDDELDHDPPGSSGRQLAVAPQSLLRPASTLGRCPDHAAGVPSSQEEATWNPEATTFVPETSTQGDDRWADEVNRMIELDGPTGSEPPTADPPQALATDEDRHPTDTANCRDESCRDQAAVWEVCSCPHESSEDELGVDSGLYATAPARTQLLEEASSGASFNSEDGRRQCPILPRRSRKKRLTTPMH